MYPVIWTEQAWPIKDLLYGQKKMFSCMIKAGNPNGTNKGAFSTMTATATRDWQKKKNFAGDVAHFVT